MNEDESSRKKTKWSLDQESFDRLLAWLDSDRERAGQRYEEISVRLVKIFVRKGCHIPEELADETINRVARKLPEIEKDWVGEDKALYFYRVGTYVYLEYIRPRPNPLPVPALDPLIELNHTCLENCLAKLSASKHVFILQYYSEDRRAKIDTHKAMAESQGMSVGTLRMKAYRIKAELRKCVLECIRLAQT